MDRIILDKYRNKIKQICHNNVRMFDNGNFIIDNVKENEKDSIIRKLKSEPYIDKVDSIAGRYDFSNPVKYVMGGSSRYYDIKGNLKKDLKESFMYTNTLLEAFRKLNEEDANDPLAISNVVKNALKGGYADIEVKETDNVEDIAQKYCQKHFYCDLNKFKFKDDIILGAKKFLGLDESKLNEQTGDKVKIFNIINSFLSDLAESNQVEDAYILVPSPNGLYPTYPEKLKIEDVKVDPSTSIDNIFSYNIGIYNSDTDSEDVFGTLEVYLNDGYYGINVINNTASFREMEGIYSHRNISNILDLVSDLQRKSFGLEDLLNPQDESLNEDIKEVVEYKGFKIEHFPITWKFKDTEFTNGGWIILSPEHFVAGDKNFPLPLRCHDKSPSKTIEFKTLDEAKAWIDKFGNNYKVTIEHGDEIHAWPREEIK